MMNQPLWIAAAALAVALIVAGLTGAVAEAVEWLLRGVRFRRADRKARLREIFGGRDESDLTYPRLDDPQLDLRGRNPGGRWPPDA